MAAAAYAFFPPVGFSRIHCIIPPSTPTVEDDREVLDLAGLDQRQRLEQLVEGAEAAGKMTNASAYFTNITLRTKK